MHDWESTRCNRSYTKDTCLICGTKRSRPKDGVWYYLVGGETCFTPPGRGNPTEAERKLARNKWEGRR